MKEQANYGNWVPEKALYLLFGGAAILLVVAVGVQIVFGKPVITGLLGVAGVLVLIEAIYMYVCHETFAFGKGNMMAGVHQHLVDHLEWDGEGTLLDIGCGAAALTVRCAKAFPNSQITAMDYWGVEWNYAKEQCEKNARLEGVENRITFQKGDAAKLEFEDGTFDAAVSNFVFHEVRTAKDKRKVVKEALRVVKKGRICPGTESGRNLRHSLYRQSGKETGFYSGICDHALDDKWDGNYIWKKIGTRNIFENVVCLW